MRVSLNICIIKSNAVTDRERGVVGPTSPKGCLACKVVKKPCFYWMVYIRYSPLITSHTCGIFCTAHTKCTGIPRKIAARATIMIAW